MSAPQEKGCRTNLECDLVYQQRILRHNSLGCTQAVHSGADYAAGVAGAFTDGIEPFNPWRFLGRLVSHDADRRTAARFGPDERGMRQESAAPAAVHDRQTMREGI